jgi:uncharacterized protein YndB with AHSA1/START domain
MNIIEPTLQSNEIAIDEVFPHAPSTIWRALTSGGLIERWLMGVHGFEPKLGNKFYFQTTPVDDWDGKIKCEILELVAERRLVYTWRSGVETANGYVPRLDTLVTWTLSPHDLGTRLQLVHSGFVLPKNESNYKAITNGWPRIITKLIAIAAELD